MQKILNYLSNLIFLACSKWPDESDEVLNYPEYINCLQHLPRSQHILEKPSKRQSLQHKDPRVKGIHREYILGHSACTKKGWRGEQIINPQSKKTPPCTKQTQLLYIICSGWFKSVLNKGIDWEQLSIKVFF